jgi:hypothetical protein
MTLKELLKHGDADDWERLSESELERLVAPYFNVTRPTPKKLKERQEAVSSGKKKRSAKNDLRDALELAARHGINVAGIKKKER